MHTHSMIVLGLALLASGCKGKPDDDTQTTDPTGTTSPDPGAAPVAVADALTVDEAGVALLDLVSNDTDADGDLDPASVMVAAAPTVGSVAVQADGSVQYTHDGSETTADSFTYTVADSEGNRSTEATVEVTVTPVNDAPEAVDDGAVVLEGDVVGVVVLANDADVDDAVDPTSVVLASDPTNGTAVVEADGSITYTHDGSETTTDSFSYMVQDEFGAASGEATVAVTVTPVADPPVAVDDLTSVDEGALETFDVLANDSDAENDLDPDTVFVVTPPGHGTAVVLPGGSIEYTHDGSETTVDALEYYVSDATGLVSNFAVVSIVVNPVNDAPVAVDDFSVAIQERTTRIDLAANDSDADDGLDLASIAIVTQPLSGTVTALADGTVEFDHDGVSFDLVDSFTYTISDPAGDASNTATVDLEIDLLPRKGMLYAVERETSNWTSPANLVTIHPETLERTLIGPIPTAAFGTLVWDVAHQRLLLGTGHTDTDGDGWTGPDQLYEIDPATAAYTLLGTVNHTNQATFARNNYTFGLVFDGSGQGWAVGESGQSATFDPVAVEMTAMYQPWDPISDTATDMVWDSKREQVVSVSYFGDLATVLPDLIAPWTYTDLVVPNPIYMNNADAAYDAVGDRIWTAGVGSDRLTAHDMNNGYTQTVLLGSTGPLGHVDGLAYIPDPTDYVLVGSYQVEDGPPWIPFGTTENCQQACGSIFGAGTYECSTLPDRIDNLAWATDEATLSCDLYPDDYAEVCSPIGCTVSAYAQGYCSATNYCWEAVP